MSFCVPQGLKPTIKVSWGNKSSENLGNFLLACYATCPTVALAWHLWHWRLLSILLQLMTTNLKMITQMALCYVVGARGCPEHGGWSQRASADGWKSGQPRDDHRAGQQQRHPATHRLEGHTYECIIRFYNKEYTAYFAISPKPTNNTCMSFS